MGPSGIRRILAVSALTMVVVLPIACARADAVTDEWAGEVRVNCVNPERTATPSLKTRRRMPGRVWARWPATVSVGFSRRRPTLVLQRTARFWC